MGISLGNHTTVLSAINATTVDCSFFAVENSNLISAADSPFPPNEVQYLVLTDGIDRKTAVGIRYSAGYPQIATRGVFDGNWLDDDWLYFSTTTPPQEFDLPLADGLQPVPAYGSNKYRKNQFNEVGITISVTKTDVGTNDIENTSLLATLPAGFRPATMVSGAAFVDRGEENVVYPAFIDIYPDGSVRINQSNAVSCSLVIASMSFLAAD